MGIFRKSEVEKVQSPGNPNIGTMFAMNIDEPQCVFSVRTEGTVEMPPVEGKSVEFLGVVTSDAIVRARPVTLPRRFAFHEIRPE